MAEANARKAEREAEERTKQEKETTAQAREGTSQSQHLVRRVYAGVVGLSLAVIAAAAVPAAASSIAWMVGTVLGVAVGGSYAVEALNKRRRCNTPRQPSAGRRS